MCWHAGKECHPSGHQWLVWRLRLWWKWNQLWRRTRGQVKEKWKGKERLQKEGTLSDLQASSQFLH